MELQHPHKERLNAIEQRLEKLTAELAIIKKTTLQAQLIDNADFLQLMNISSSTAQNWRNKGIIAYSQIENKIYYKVSDIETLLDLHYRPFKKSN
ncbi:helix-turn-helix domain-containing protein [Nonlabens ponticola]|uniref:DNA-binding protein n=1 Tax=Nonlabens ponticola TaxID=2496866 RepID=A0A3S9MY84_9FLAO|nr:helix-turn-helix domain-containing protein [Nonlabens ponticola]AZQ44108.1 DNA-binding protein [Nonlabens ponticola]